MIACLDMNLAATCEGPVFPACFFEDNHDVLWINARGLKARSEFCEELLFDFHASACGEQYLHERKVICSSALNIRVVQVKAKVFGTQLEDALELI